MQTQHLKFIYPSTYQNLANYLAKHHEKFEHVYLQYTQLFPNLPKAIPIVFNPTPIHHNGLASPWPQDHIVIHVAPPDQDDVFSGSVNPLFETFVHELAHIAHFQCKSTFYQNLSNIFGSIITPVGMTPRWLLEGFAVWMESRFSGFGRGNNTYTQGLVELLAPSWPALADLNGFSESYPAGLAPYLYGYLFMEYLSQTYGPKAVFDYIKQTGSGYPLVQHTSTQNIFQKKLDTLWSQAHQYYLKQSKALPSIHQRTRPLTFGGIYKGRGVVLNNALYYWDSQPFLGSRLIRVPLENPQATTVLKTLQATQAHKPLLTACHDTLFSIQYHLNDDQHAFSLYAWKNGRPEPLTQFKHTRGGKALDLACINQSVVLLSTYDLTHTVSEYSLEGQLHRSFQLPSDFTPLQIVTRSDSLLVLGLSNTQISQLYDPHSNSVKELSWARHRKLYALHKTQNTYLGIVDGPHGRNIVSLDRTFQPIDEWAHILPTQLVEQQKNQLILRYLTPHGEQFGIMSLDPNVPYNTSVVPSVPHRPSRIVLPASALVKQSSLEAPVVQPYNPKPYLKHQYWVPLLLATYNIGVGLQTGGMDPLHEWSHALEAVMFFAPLAGSIHFEISRSTLVQQMGVRVGYAKHPHALGLEQIEHDIAISLPLTGRLSYTSSFFMALTFSPQLTNQGELQYRFYTPMRLNMYHITAFALYPYGWTLTFGLSPEFGTVFTDGFMRVFRVGKMTPAHRQWRLNLTTSLYGSYCTPILLRDAGLFQSLQGMYRFQFNSKFGPLHPELFWPRPFEKLLHVTALPLHTRFDWFTGDSLLIYKFRPFVRLAHVDKGFPYFPIFLESLWLEGIWDVALDPEYPYWFGSFGLKSYVMTTLFYNLPVYFSVYAGLKWKRSPQFDDLFIGFEASSRLNI